MIRVTTPDENCCILSGARRRRANEVFIISTFLNTGIRQLSLEELNIASDEKGKAQIVISEGDKRDAGKLTITLPGGRRISFVQRKPGEKP